MIEQTQMQAPQKEANVYASREDFHTIFNEDLRQLYQSIREMKPRPIHSNSRLSNTSFSEIEQLSSAPDRHFALEAVLNLEDFERFVFTMSVLEHYSDHDCALLLGCSIREILEARGRAFGKLVDSSQRSSSPDQLRMAKFRYTMHDAGMSVSQC